MKSPSSGISASSSTPAAPPGKARRVKVAVACQNCRRKKIKCDGRRPACSSCRTKSRSRTRRGSCSYQGLHSAAAEPARESSVQKTPSFSREVDLGDQGPPSLEAPAAPENHSNLSRGHPLGRFASDINAAVTTKLGPPSAERPTLPHAADVPLFGILGFHETTHQHIDNVLPPREEADKLLDIYWRYIHPLEPFVNKPSVSLCYKELFAGNSGGHDSSSTHRVFLSTLNAIFAVATQLQESLPAEVRQETSRAYFHRAWTFLRPEAIIWEPASLEMVQCMLLISRYLQLTNHSHQTWMAIGSAVRAAQSLGLDTPQAAIGNDVAKAAEKRRLWQCCVFMDRTASWTSARVSTVPLMAPGSKPAARQDENSSEENDFLSKTLELYEFTNRALLLYSPDGNAVTDLRFGPENESGIGMVLQIDDSIIKWETGIPSNLRVESFPETQDRRAETVSYRQAVLLRLRLLHARITLLKPMLARYCSSGQSTRHSLNNKVLRDCGVLCIENAQEMTGLVARERRSDINPCSIAWWYRVFYLHVAGSVLLASMLQADDLFTQSVSESWQATMLALRAHGHLSVSVQECITTFDTLAAKINEVQNSGSERVGVGAPVGCDRTITGVNFEDVFQDLGIDLDSCLFGMEDMAWAGNLF